MTEQRRIIVEELMKVSSHPTAPEIYELVRKRLPRISLGTVYRNLEILSDSGMIRKLESAGTRKRFDGTLENHYHGHCIRCGAVEDLFFPALSQPDEVSSRAGEFKILWHRLEFCGVCPGCREEWGRDGAFDRDLLDRDACACRE